MKIKQILTLASLLCLALTGCVKDDCSVSVTTGNASFDITEASGVSSKLCTFSAVFDWRKRNHPKGYGAIYYGKTNNLSFENNLGSSRLNELEDGTTFLVQTVHDLTVQSKDICDDVHEFCQGDTMYYRAYAKVVTEAGNIYYIYGEEKCIVIP